MTVLSKTKFHVAISVEANEAVDTEFFSPETGQCKLIPSYHTENGNVQLSGDGTNWIADSTGQDSLFAMVDAYPRYIRLTVAGIIYFNTSYPAN